MGKRSFIPTIALNEIARRIDDTRARWNPVNTKYRTDILDLSLRVFAWLYPIVRNGELLYGIENNYAGENPQHGLRQRELIAVLKRDGWVHWRSVVGVSPGEVKRALTGKGNAVKADMVEMAEMLYPDVMIHWPSDGKKTSRAQKQREAIADAIGVALAAKGEK